VIVNFWTNEPNHPQVERKLLLPPGEKPGLLGGGAAWAWPDYCEQYARQDYQHNPNPPVTLEELRAEGLVVDGSDQVDELEVTNVCLNEYKGNQCQLPQGEVGEDELYVAHGDVEGDGSCRVLVWDSGETVMAPSTATWRLVHIRGATHEQRLEEVSNIQSQLGNCPFVDGGNRKHVAA
jgi:hypothetical protein